MIDWLIHKLGGITLKRLNEADWENELDVVDLVRERLEGVKLDNVLGNLNEAETKEYITEMARVADNKWMKLLLNDLKVKQIMFTVKQARNMEEVSFGRATINGISLIEEELVRVKALDEESKKPKGEFDEHAII